MIPNAAELSRLLAERSEEVVMRLYPQGRRVNGSIVLGNLVGDPGDSLKIDIHGQHSGQWKDWATGEHGDLLDLWAHREGKPLPEVFAEVRDYLGIRQPDRLAPKPYSKPKERPCVAPINPAGKVTKWLMEQRGLDPLIIAAFKIEGDSEKKAIVFPCYSVGGELINRSYRTLDAEKKVWQEKGAAPCLFGWHALHESAYRERKVLICEGQIDCMTWTQWGINALSIPNGNGETWIDYEWDHLFAFDTIYLAYDNDAAGQEMCAKAIKRLGPSRCMIVTVPEKDANDCLKKGHTSADAIAWIAAAKAPSINGLITADQLASRLEAALAPKPEPFTLPFFRFKAGDGFYFRPAEVTVWTGETSAGKSTFLNYVMLSAISEHLPCYIASFEAKVETTVIKLLRTMLSGNPAPEQARKLVMNYGSYIALCDVVGYIKPDLLMEQMQFCFQRYGTQHYFIDSFMRIEGLEEEYDQQGKFLNRLQEFAKSTDTHIHLVCHTKKIKEGERPGKQDIKGSSLIANNADNIASIRRNREKDAAIEAGKSFGGMHDTEVSVTKQRDTGWLGTFKLKFDPATGAFGKL
jgi:twinkle protein